MNNTKHFNDFHLNDVNNFIYPNYTSFYDYDINNFLNLYLLQPLEKNQFQIYHNKKQYFNGKTFNFLFNKYLNFEFDLYNKDPISLTTNITLNKEQNVSKKKISFISRIPLLINIQTNPFLKVHTTTNSNRRDNSLIGLTNYSHYIGLNIYQSSLSSYTLYDFLDHKFIISTFYKPKYGGIGLCIHNTYDIEKKMYMMNLITSYSNKSNTRLKKIKTTNTIHDTVDNDYELMFGINGLLPQYQKLWFSYFHDVSLTNNLSIHYIKFGTYGYYDLLSTTNNLIFASSWQYNATQMLKFSFDKHTIQTSWIFKIPQQEISSHISFNVHYDFNNSQNKLSMLYHLEID